MCLAVPGKIARHLARNHSDTDFILNCHACDFFGLRAIPSTPDTLDWYTRSSRCVPRMDGVVHQYTAAFAAARMIRNLALSSLRWWSPA